MTRAVRLALVVFAVQLLIVVGVVSGWVPVHPIVIMLPLVGLLNGRVEGRGREGLGLVVLKPARSLLLAFVFAALTLGRYLLVLRFGGIPLRVPPLTTETAVSLIGVFAVDVLIIALFEEVVNRGYIQTRLQSAWGFSGVVVATALFATLHLPSALLNLGPEPQAILFRFVQAGLGGFVFGYVYWRTGSALTTIVVHGLNNFSFSLSQQLSGLTGWQVITNGMALQLVWLIGQVGLVLVLCDVLFGDG